MSWNTIFLLSFLPAAPFWFLMIFLPNWKWTQKIIASPLIVVPAAMLYSIVLLPHIAEAYNVLGNMSLDATASLFGTEIFALIVWLHFIAIDLLAGRWAYLDSQKMAASPIVMAIVFIVIINLAPLGVLLYLLVRQVYLSPKINAKTNVASAS